MIELKLVQELKKNTLQEIIDKHGGNPGQSFNNMYLSIWDVREILYSEAKKIAKREMDKELEDKW